MHRRGSSILLTGGLTVCAAACLTPVVWVLCASVKTGDDLFDSPLLPWAHLRRVTLSNYVRLFTDQSMGRWMVNSVFVASTQTVAAVLLASLGGFAVAKYDFPGRRVVLSILLGTMLLPYQVLLPSSYELMRQLGWLDTYAAILAPGAVSVFGLFLFSRAMETVPDELLHAGRIDGASELRLWWEIVVPLLRPTTAAFALLSFTAAWNAFLWPQIVLQNQDKYTLPVALANLSANPGAAGDYGLLMAATVLSVVPVVFLFFAMQSDFVAGLTRGAIK